MAAMLHDTVEDTDTTLEEIAREFGEEVASIVDVSLDSMSREYYWNTNVSCNPCSRNVQIRQILRIRYANSCK